MGFFRCRAPMKIAIALGVEEGAGGDSRTCPYIDRRIGEDELVDVLEDPGTWLAMR